MKIINSLILVFIITTLVSNNQNAQTSWHHYASNPVIELGSEGEWDSQHIGYGMFVLHNGNTYHMWYQGQFNGVDAIGYATSTDGMEWSKYENNPVLEKGEVESWDGLDLQMGCVFLEDNLYKMYYDARGSYGWVIGLATSPDGINWEKDTLNNPVLRTGPSGSWDDYAVWSPHVIKVDAKYKMWYTANELMSDYTDQRLGYAESDDGVTWTKHSEPVMEEGDPAVFLYETESPAVVFDGELYHMWYSRENETLNHQIDYAVSNDGINWTKFHNNPAVKSGIQNDWFVSLFHPNVIMHDNISKMWFVGGGGNDWAFGYAEDFSSKVHCDTVSVEQLYYDPHTEPVNIIGRVVNPEGHALKIEATALTDEGVSESIELFDDGSNNDGDADDGIYGGYFNLTSENNYTVGIKTVDLMNNFTRDGFEWCITDRFTTKGPIVFEVIEFTTDDPEPNTGTRSKFNLSLYNTGNTDTVYNVDINIIIPDSLQSNGLITNTTTGIPKWGDIPPGEGLTCWSRSYALSFSAECEDGLYSLGLEITSNGEPFWYDTFDITVGLAEEFSNLPRRFELAQNYPNPFNPSTTIQYSIPALEALYANSQLGNYNTSGLLQVNLVVYDITGQEVVTLVNKNHRPGNYIVTFETTGLSSGVYFYKLKAGNFIQVKKMLLLR